MTKSIIVIIAAPIVVTIGGLLLLIALTATVLLCYKAKKKERYLVKLQAGKDSYQLEDNPRYDSATGIHQCYLNFSLVGYVLNECRIESS